MYRNRMKAFFISHSILNDLDQIINEIVFASVSLKKSYSGI